MADFPPIPATAFSHLGPVPVIPDGMPREELGLWEPGPRTIKIQDDAVPAAKWQTFWHESMHTALSDAGVKLPPKVEESVCDAIGTYLAAAMRAGFLKVTP